MEALVGDVVLAIDQERWQAMARSPSPQWRAIRAQACFSTCPCGL